MTRHLLLFCCLCVLLFTSCHTRKQATAHHSKDPRFIDDIYLDRHNKNSQTADAVDKNGHYPDKNHPGKTGKTGDGAEAKPELTRSVREKYAGILGVRNKEITNARLYNFIDEWYGVPYHMGGLDKKGIDCSGFTKKLYESVFGMDIVHSSSDMYNTCEHIKNVSNAAEGDLVFFKTKGHQISHVGVYLVNDYFVHASTTQGIMISSLKEDYWAKHFVGAGRIRKG